MHESDVEIKVSEETDCGERIMHYIPSRVRTMGGCGGWPSSFPSWGLF
jgi:hypothetical protein